MNRYPLKILGMGSNILNEGRVPDGVSQSFLARKAIEEALLNAKMSECDIDIIINASESIETFIPEGATLMQGAMGWGNSGIPCLTVQNGWNGFIQALETCICFGLSGRYRNMLVIISEIYTKIVDETNLETQQYFKDGAVAMVLSSESNAEEGYACYPYICNTVNNESVKSLFSIGNIANGKKGKELCISYKHDDLLKEAIKFLKTDAMKYVEKNGGADYVVAQHFGEEYLSCLSSVFKGCRILSDEKYAGFGAAEIPLNLCKARNEGIIKDGDKVILCGIGSGVNSAIIMMVC